MNQRELRGVEVAIEEMFSDVGNTQHVSYRKFSPGAIKNIYQESKVKTYAAPIALSAIIIEYPSAQQLEDWGFSQKVALVVQVSRRELLTMNLIDGGDNFKGDTTKDIIEYRGEAYMITDIKRQAQLGSTFQIWAFGANKVV